MRTSGKPEVRCNPFYFARRWMRGSSPRTSHHLPCHGDDTCTRVNVARNALNLVQLGEKSTDVLVDRANCGKLREHVRYPFIELALCLGQLADALCQDNPVVLLKASQSPGKTVANAGQCSKDAGDAGIGPVQGCEATLERGELRPKLHKATHAALYLLASRIRHTAELTQLLDALSQRLAVLILRNQRKTAFHLVLGALKLSEQRLDGPPFGDHFAELAS